MRPPLRSTLTALLLSCATSALAMPIVTVYPDTDPLDFAEFATIQDPDSLDWELTPTPANDLGRGPFGLVRFSEEIFFGLHILFHQPVIDVTLTARQIGRCLDPPEDAVEWFSFDASGELIGDGGSRPAPACHVPFLAEVPDDTAMRLLVLGGTEGSATMEFDRLQFQVAGNATPVPAPGMLMLLVIGLAGTAWSRRQRFALRSQ